MRFVFYLSLTLLLGACKPPAPAPAAQRKLSVIATVYPLADLARQIGGELVDVSWVIESGQSLDGVLPDQDLRNRLRSADLVLMGDTSEAWATEGSGGGEQHARFIRLETLPAAREMAQPGLLWLDPIIIKDAARELSKRLQVLRPVHSAEIIGRTDDFIAKIDALYQKHQTLLATALNRRLLVLNDDFAPLLKRFALLPIPTSDIPPTRLTDENIRLIQYISRQNNTPLLILPSDTPAAVVEDIRVRSGLQIVLLDPLGSSAAGGRNSYLDLLAWNLEQLAKAITVQ